MPVLQIRLLADFHLAFDGQAVTGVSTARLQALIAYLVLHRNSPQLRHHLAFLFWPDTPETQALTNLRNLLHKLRQALPQSDLFLATGNQTVQWRPEAPFTLDVARFETALEQAASRAELEVAVALYQGDLLPSCYDEWIAPERNQLQRRMVAALSQLVTIVENERDYRAAITYAEQLLSFEPFDEATFRALMRLHAANGDRGGALRVYQRCADVLNKEFAAPPAAETQELYQRLLRGEMQPPAPAARNGQRAGTQAQLPLVGRTQEWKIILDSWSRATGGKPHLLCLSGEAGIGKTRLAEELVAWIAHQGYPTATARCYAAEGSLTYTPVIAWLRSAAIHHALSTIDPLWRGELARLLPELVIEQPHLPQPAPITQGWQRQRFFEAVTRALLLPAKPLLLFIDDLQWADRETTEWLHYLLRFDPHAPLLVLATLRREEIASRQPLQTLLAALRRDALLVEVSIGPLSIEETATMALQVTGNALSPTQTTHLYETTEGNPLFVMETLQTEAQRIDRGEQQTFLLDALSPKMQTVIQGRLAQLSPAARDLANVASAIGRAFSYVVLSKAADQADEVLVDGLDELCRLGIVREHGSDSYDFTHSKLRETAYNGLSAARRRLLHRRIAQSLEGLHQSKLDSVSGQVAAHYELAGEAEQAIPHYWRAAEVAAQVYANEEAIRTYRHALALLEGLPAPKQTIAPILYERVAEILLWTGQVDDSRIAYQRALARIPLSEPVTQARLHRKIGNTWREQYHYAEAQRSYAQAENILGDPPIIDANTSNGSGRTPEWWHEWIQVLLEIDYLYYWIGPMHSSKHLHARLKPAVERFGTLQQQVKFLQQNMMLEFRQRRSTATQEMVEASQSVLHILQAAEDHSGLPSVQFLTGFVLLWSGNPHDALEPLQRALVAAEHTGDLSLQARCLTYIATAERQCGRDKQTEQVATRSLAMAKLAHMPEYIGTAEANLAWVAWKSDNAEGARRHALAALTAWSRLPVGHGSAVIQWTALCPLIALAVDAAQPNQAIEYVRLLLHPLQQQLPDSLATPFEQAVAAWENGNEASTIRFLQHAIAQAQELHYL